MINSKTKRVLSSKLMLYICISNLLFCCVTFLVCILNVVISKSPIKLFFIMAIYLSVNLILCISLWITYIDGKKGKVCKGGITGIQIYAIVISAFSILLWGIVTIVICVVGGIISGAASVFESTLVMTLSMLIIACGMAIGAGIIWLIASSTSEMLSWLKKIKGNHNDLNTRRLMRIKIAICFNILFVFGMVTHQVIGIVSQVSLNGIAKIFLYETNLIKIFGLKMIPTPIVAILNILCVIRTVIYFVYWILVFRIIRFTKDLFETEEVEKINYVEKSNDDINILLNREKDKSDMRKEENHYDNQIYNIGQCEMVVLDGSITCICGNDAGATYPLYAGEEIIIGKDSSVSNIVVNPRYKQVSRKHCGIKYDKNKEAYLIIDYSTNGTFVNGRRLTREMCAILPKGSIVKLAKENLEYRLD